MVQAHVIPGFKGVIHDPIALAREQYENKSSTQKKDIFDASQLLATVRDCQARLATLEEKTATQETLINGLLTRSK